MALEMGWKSTNSVARAIGELERMGHLRRAAGHSRALQLTKRNRFPQVSLVGIIAAGKPIMPFEDVEEVEVPPMLMGNGETFALRVKGDSMRDDGILEGDIVLVEKRAEARNGEVVVALIDGEETTLKQFSLKGDTVTLTPANTTMEPMRFMADRVTIQGVVVGQMRTYRPVSP
jgi:repressor LexA